MHKDLPEWSAELAYGGATAQTAPGIEWVLPEQATSDLAASVLFVKTKHNDASHKRNSLYSSLNGGAILVDDESELH